MTRKSKIIATSIALSSILSISNSAFSKTSIGIDDEDFALKSNTVKAVNELLSGMNGFKRSLCEMTVKNGGSSRQIEDACFNSKSVAWFQDRDNSMTPIDLDEASVEGTVGRAMGVMYIGKRRGSQAVQVCPGVYLTTAHASLSDPRKNETAKPLSRNIKVYPYPLDPKVKMKPSSDLSFTSPRIGASNFLWNEPSTDYLFIKVKKPLRPNDYVEILDTSQGNFFDVSSGGSSSVDLHLYRAKSKFKMKLLKGKLTPDYYNKISLDLKTTMDNYKAPQKVNQKCLTNLSSPDPSLVSTDCPFENGVSGSPLISIIKNKPYLSGMATRAKITELPTFNNNPEANEGSRFLKTSQFCFDYEKICGRPCKTLNHTVPQKRQQRPSSIPKTLTFKDSLLLLEESNDLPETLNK